MVLLPLTSLLRFKCINKHWLKLVDISLQHLCNQMPLENLYFIGCYGSSMGPTTTTTTPSAIPLTRDLGRSESRQPYPCKYYYSQRGRFQRPTKILRKPFCN